MVFTESLEDAKKQREQREQNKQNNKEKEKIKNDFFYLPEITNLSENLKTLVKPDEKQKIENRLLLKYEKDTGSFDFKKSLKEVLLWENIWWIPSSWILLENNNWETIDKKAKESIYKKLISEKEENLIEEWQEKNNQENKTETINAQYEELNEERDINNPQISVLNRLAKGWKLSVETKEIIDITINENLKIDNDFYESIENSNEKKVIKDTLKLIPENKEAIPVDNLYNFKQDFPDLSDIAINWKDSKHIKEWEDISEYDILAYEFIWENYIKIWDNTEDKRKNYSTAIKTASANILKNNKTIDRNTDTFKQAILDIHSENKEKQFEWLSKLIEIKEENNTEIWAIASKLKTKPKSKLEDQLKNLKAEFNHKINNSTLTKNRQKEIIEEWDKINELLSEEPKWWDVMSGWKKEIEQNKNWVEIK